MNEMLKQYLLTSGMVAKIEELDKSDVRVTTTILQIEEVIRELYTSGYINFKVTIVDSLNVKIRTETI